MTAPDRYQSGGKKFQSLMEIRRIVEYRDGCVYRTESLGLAWVDFDEAALVPKGYVSVPPSTSVPLPWVRRVPIGTPEELPKGFSRKEAPHEAP